MIFYKYVIKNLIVILLILLYASWAGATSPYYVDCSNTTTTGSAGSFADPFKGQKDFEYYRDNTGFSDGDDVYFLEGSTCVIENNEASYFRVDISGVNTSNRTIFGCYDGNDDFDCDGDRPVLSHLSNNINAGILRFNNAEFIRVEHIKFEVDSEYWEDCAPGGDGSSTGVYLQGNEWTMGYNIVTDCEFYHIGHYSVLPWEMLGHNIFTHNIIEDSGNGIYTGDERHTTGTTHDYYAYNACDGIVGYATCDDPLLKLDGHCIASQKGTDSIMEYNTDTDGEASFIFWGNEASNIKRTVTRFNESYNSAKQPITVQGKYCDGVTWCYQLDPDGSGRDGNPNVGNNFIYGNILSNSVTNADYHRPAILVSGLQPTSSLKTSYIFNNTVYKANDAAAQVRYGSDYSTWVNNIFVSEDRLENQSNYKNDDFLFMFSEQNTYGGTRSTFDVDYNLYWSVAGDPTTYDIWRDIVSDDHNWSTWTDVTRGWDEHGDVANPDFTDAGNENFTLVVGSPAINAGRYFTYVTAVSGTTITVANNTWFHGDFGLVDEDGAAITGMEITFYDTTNGLQQKTITSNDITYAAPGSFVINTVLSGYLTGGDSNPANTTQVSLKHYETAPDLGEEQSGYEGGCQLPEGHSDYCRDCGPCAEGEGDCDNDSECEDGLYCDQVVGIDRCAVRVSMIINGIIPSGVYFK